MPERIFCSQKKTKKAHTVPAQEGLHAKTHYPIKEDLFSLTAAEPAVVHVTYPR